MGKGSIVLLTFVIINYCVSAIKFRRTIEAVGYPYSKILMSLGSCKAILMFTENKIWGSVSLNRIFDIYYKSDIDDYKVSKVEVVLVINHSDVMAYSEVGVGHSDFSASLYLPTDTAVIFYSLKIYTCSHPAFEKSVTIEDAQSMPFFDGSAT